MNLRSRFLEGRGYDAVLFLTAPLWALACAALLPSADARVGTVFFMDAPMLASTLALRTIIHAHLVIVFFRSHGNRAVFERHRWRFVAVPLVLLVAALLSQTVLALVLVITTYWDIYHSSLQTFGIGRLYDQRAGADVTRSRRVDVLVCHALYIGPFIAGPLWSVTVQSVDRARGLNPAVVGPLVDTLARAEPAVHAAGMIAMPVLIAVWGVDWVRRVRAGNRMSVQKLALFASTGVASIWAWMANPFGHALFIVNVFHAVQYFGIVWWSERDGIGRALGTAAFGRWATLACFLVAAGCYGFWIGAVSDAWDASGARVLMAIANVVALMHFWYDGFVWSVRKGHVAAALPTGT